VFFLLAKRLFQRVRVGLVHFVGDIFTDPGAGFVEFERGIFLRNLLHADQNFQSVLLVKTGKYKPVVSI